MLKPYLLRRKKDDVSMALKLPPKTEQVLFCRLTDSQRSLYKDILRSPEVEAVFERRMAAFKAITTLRKLCNHPALVFQHGKFIWNIEDEVEDITAEDQDDAKSLCSFTWGDSGKLVVLSKLLPLWFSENNKVLIFSQVILKKLYLFYG